MGTNQPVRGTVVQGSVVGAVQGKVQGAVVAGGAAPAAAVKAKVVSAPPPPPDDGPPPTERLFKAVKLGKERREVIELLKELGDAAAREACTARDEQGHTIAHWASKRGDVALLKAVLDRGASVSDPSGDGVGMRPLHWACTEGRMACARLLVDRGADADARDKQGCTPLVVAAQWGQADCAAYLVKIGANPKILDRNDDSALHWAAYKGNVEIVGMLHHLGLALDDADGYGQTPLHLAALRGNLGVCEYLLVDAEGAERTRLAPKDKNGKTPLDLATDKKHGQARRFLRGRVPLCDRGAKAFLSETFCDRTSSGALLVNLCVGDAGMKWPWFAMVFNKVLAQAMYYAYFLSPLTPAPGASVAFEVPAWVHAAAFNTQFVAWAAFLSCWRGDPGLLKDRPCAEGLRKAYDAYFDRLVTGERADDAVPVTLCHSCHIVRPLRSKHCRSARQCVAGFDHFCPYVGTTVGLGNYRWFYLYCCSFTLAAIQWEVIAFTYWRAAGATAGLMAAMAWFGLFILFGLAMVLYHTQLVAANLTTNEHMNLSRYEHFRDEAGNIRNPFDEGFCANLADRFLPPVMDDLPVVQQVTRAHRMKRDALIK